MKTCETVKKRVMGVVLGICLVTALLALDPDKKVTQYIIDGWNAETGLPQSSVYAVLQTGDGYIWIGTEEGLARFDGVEFIVFDGSNTPAISKNFISCLLEDREKNLWIGTLGGGIVVYHEGKFKRWTEEDGLSHNYIYSLFEDPSGNIWIGTDRGGVNRWNKEANTFQVYKREDSLADSYIRAFCLDSQGNFWIGTRKGLCLFKDNRLRPYPLNLPGGVGAVGVNAILEDHRKNLWIGTTRGLYRRREEKWILYRLGEDTLESEIKFLFEDRDLNIWIGTEGYGLTRYSRGTFSTLTQKDGLLGNAVPWLTEDREGNLWVGTIYGLNRLKEGKFTAITTREGLADDVVFSVFEDSNGYLWIGTDNGLDRYKDGEFMHFTARGGFTHNVVDTIYEDSQGYIWVGADKGLTQLKNTPHTISEVKAYLNEYYIPAVAEDREGKIWIGTMGGAVQIREQGLRWFTQRDGLGSDDVSLIYKDSRGDLWFSTLRRGITLYRGGTFTVFAEAEGFSGDTVQCIREDADGVIWFGTNSGLSRFKDGKFTNYTQKNGLFHNNIYHILEDKKGNLWMSTNKGIFQVSKKKLNDFAERKISHIDSVAYDKSDGMKSVECNGGYQTAGCKTKDGKLWFPTIKGVVYIDPEKIILNTVQPPVLIQRVLLDGEAAVPGQTVEIPPGVKRLEIHFTALSFTNPQRVQLKYRLEGYDEQWVRPHRQRTALYTNLDAGTYRFHVIAGNDDGFWNETGAALHLKVIPPFWEAWWFRVIALIGFAILSYLVIHFSSKYIALAAFWKKQKYVGNLKLLEIIGSGGMGTIYKAQNMLDKSQTVALKVLKEELFKDETNRKRFKHEAAIIDQLDHPHIVSVIERGESRQNLFIAMEYLEGKTLTQKVNEEKLEIKIALHIMRQIADALAKLHSKNIIHRDLKPDNIMLIERKGDPHFVKLLDFGLARSQFQTRLTQTGVVIGTINYLSPEQISGKDSSAASDIYSLGILFYEMLKGEKPFLGETTIDIMKQIMDKVPIPPHRFRDDIPLDLSHLIMKMLEKDRKSRLRIDDVQEYLKTIEYKLKYGEPITPDQARRGEI
jgi:ligand-binding sensor domain-containing protein/tRNA A-37 threonylcarbamoyl transferase component Bud32